MTRTTRIVTASAIAAAVLAAGAIIGAHLQDGAATVAVTSALTTTAASPTEAPLTAATNAPTPTPTATTVTIPAAGATVPADQVAAVRTAGGHVYVSPNGTGDGLVVGPAAPLPPVAITDAHAASPNTAWPSDGRAFSANGANIKALADAYTKAGLSAFIVMRYPTDFMPDGTIKGTLYTVGAINVPVDRTQPNPHGPTVAAALAAGQALFDKFPNVPIITFDAVQ